MEVEQAFESLIEQEQLIGTDQRIIIAFSGGPDSVALLHLLHRISADRRLALCAVHVDHGFRGEESAQEAQWAQSFCQARGIGCVVRSADVPAYIAQSGMNAQAAAREIRYGLIVEEAARFGADLLAFGHHADDQVETVLRRVLHGTGLSGLSGMSSSRNEGEYTLIRPLLGIRKSQILQYLNDHHLSYCTDSSNESRKYERNRLRLELLPQMRQFNPRVDDALLRLSKIAAEDDDFLQQQLLAWFGKHVHKVDGGWAFTRKTYLLLHAALQKRLIPLILRYLSPISDLYDYHRIEQVHQAIVRQTPTTLKLDLGDGICFVREYEQIRCMHGQAAVSAVEDYAYVLQGVQSRLYLAEPGVWMSMKEAGPEDQTSSFNDRGLGQYAHFDLAHIRWPLTIRSRLPGDRMWVKGMSGSKKVKDILIDDKVPPSKRAHLPLLLDGDQRILWVCGVRRSAHALVDERTQHILHICCESDIK